MKLKSVIKCPKCGFKREETIPTDSCQVLYKCSNCGEILQPQGEDCCVFCTYGSEKCLPKQTDN